ncbi:MAG TPA: hypothetical protein VGE74_23445 [Gemmata sp.]
MSTHGRLDRRAFLGAVAATAVGGPLARAQNLGEKKVAPIDLPLDNADVWTLHFRYKPIRIAQVDGFDKEGRRAKQMVWYMWYQVYNLPREGRAGEPVTFLPEFELVTRDLNTTHLDEPQPFIFDQLRKREDTTVSEKYPEGILDLKNTITISKRPIPVTKPDAIPRVVSGLAIWTDMAEVAPKTNKFSVYISGLSNGLAKEELRTGELLIKRKTLQINFVRPTDDNKPVVTDIRPDDTNGPAEQWVYRTTSVAKSIGGAGPKVPPAPPPR